MTLICCIKEGYADRFDYPCLSGDKYKEYFTIKSD